MPQLEYAIPCQLTSLDQRTNALSLFGIIESLEVVRTPGQTAEEAAARALVPFEVATLWRRLEGEPPGTAFTQVLTLASPDGNEEELSRLRFQILHFRHHLLIQLPPLGVGQEGEYVLKVYLARGGDEDRPGDRGELRFDYPIRVTSRTLPIVIPLLPLEIEYLQRPVAGQGGFQSLLRRLQNQIADDRLVLSIPDAERLIRYASQYGAGGFQDRLRRIVEQAQAQLHV